MGIKQRVLSGAVLLLAAGVLCAHLIQGRTVALFSPAGEVAHKERNLMFFALSLSIIVVVPVFIMLFAFAWKYREGNKKAKYKPDWDRHRTLEAIWWLIPFSLIFILSIVTWNSSHDLDPYKPLHSSVQPITVQVVALDWKWLFIYPEQHIATLNYLEIPVNTPVNFDITSDAPMNSFWIPQLGGQVYAMPGMSTQLHLNATKVGNYAGSSANISGRGFAGMDFVTYARSSSDFKKWYANAQRSSNKLTLDAYNKLALPSQNNAPTTYASSTPGLYESIVMKYMEPTQ